MKSKNKIKNMLLLGLFGFTFLGNVPGAFALNENFAASSNENVKESLNFPSLILISVRSKNGEPMCSVRYIVNQGAFIGGKRAGMPDNFSFNDLGIVYSEDGQHLLRIGQKVYSFPNHTQGRKSISIVNMTKQKIYLTDDASVSKQVINPNQTLRISNDPSEKHPQGSAEISDVECEMPQIKKNKRSSLLKTASFVIIAGTTAFATYYCLRNKGTIDLTRVKNLMGSFGDKISGYSTPIKSLAHNFASKASNCLTYAKGCMGSLGNKISGYSTQAKGLAHNFANKASDCLTYTKGWIGSFFNKPSHSSTQIAVWNGRVSSSPIQTKGWTDGFTSTTSAYLKHAKNWMGSFFHGPSNNSSLPINLPGGTSENLTRAAQQIYGPTNLK